MNVFWRLSKYRFQPFSHTEPDRYPWLFSFVRDRLGDGPDRGLLSFGCSTGLEALSLRGYFPEAKIKGLDIDPRNIARCRRLRRNDIAFGVAATTEDEPSETFDAIFCLAVLCNGKLVREDAKQSDPLIYFETFERMVTDFARCLKPGGLLCLVTTNFRFCDTRISAEFDSVLRIDPAIMAPDRHFGRDNRRIEGDRYTEVAFVKRHIAPAARSYAP